MNFTLLKEVINLLENFDSENKNEAYPSTLKGFTAWIADRETNSVHTTNEEAEWEGKENGRTPESAIATSLVRLNRYAKTYSKSAIADSDFTTQEDFIYLINLKAFGAMTKMELIKKNIHDKPVGILIINRLIKQGWVQQTDSTVDKRTKVIEITEEGKSALEAQMNKIRQATHIVSGNLTHSEKMDLIRILNKLDHFHSPIFSRHIETKDLIETVYKEYSFQKN
ncbi:MarR family transcriptional regulator [Chryseobacterium soli]|uniref:MarR family transcriptional regulator n=1 Tax=Chryseobacterium soli TaxID=445961 RepID=A0A086A625_9FLAO|nr:MarR family transcriptional regulator [Chryseobacterium soli]KFF12139.1 MarR family transcriptional regulator [Chryseobacterium soli]